MTWKPGESGNSAGRPRGVGEVAALRAAIKPAMPELLQRVMLQAMAGDTTAQRLLLERVFPALKPQAAEVAVEMQATGSLLDKGDAILQAVAAGDIPPDIGSQLIAALGQLGALKKIDELEERLRALEAPTATDGSYDDLA